MTRALPLLCLALAAPAWADGAFSQSPRPSTAARKAGRRWMARLPDEASLAALSLPGTHNTCARFGGPLAQCQTWTLADQLAAGVRVLDIRCRHLRDDFRIHHGLIDQRTTFAAVQATCLAFLRANPTECLVLMVKSEYRPRDNTRPFAATFRALTAPYADRWLDSRAAPTLGAARGKLVLIGRERGLGGVPWSALDRQDAWQIPSTAALEAKVARVERQLVAARLGPADRWFVNYASGSGWGARPHTVARRTNAAIYRWLGRHPRGRVGTVMLDFPGEALIARVYSRPRQAR